MLLSSDRCLYDLNDAKNNNFKFFEKKKEIDEKNWKNQQKQQQQKQLDKQKQKEKKRMKDVKAGMR